MIYKYYELLSKYKNERQIYNAVKNGKLYKISNGLYSDNQNYISVESISKKYSKAIITGQTALYFYNLTTDPGEKYTVAVKNNGNRIKHLDIDVNYQEESIFKIGLENINGINIYNRERLLIELFRNKRKYSDDLFKEIVNEYRRISDELDGFKLDLYLTNFKRNTKLKNDIYSIVF